MEQSASISNFGEPTGAPKTLKTLCILSLVMGGLMIILSLFNVKAAYDTDKTQLETENIIKFNPGQEEVVYAMEEGKAPAAIAGLIMEIVSVIGVVLMLKSKKTGFYIYVAAELLPYVINIALKGMSQTMAEMSLKFGPMGRLVMAFLILSVVFDLLFIFLYSRQVKYLK
ncbi:MAG TPA: hypothetical protein VFF27_08065 [Bacteroidia bacterium]|jgi:hypothetical protein|nr:hypothetical protein [Bacteroidia bacterium]